MLPALDGKKILDLVCGYGENCISFSKMGASKVVGIDISEKMLNAAKKNNYGFTIQNVLEPLPTEDIIQKNSRYMNDFHKPDFLLIKAKKGLFSTLS